MKPTFIKYFVITIFVLVFYFCFNMTKEFNIIRSNYIFSLNKINKKCNEQNDETKSKDAVNVFIDLGANKGDSIYNFVGLAKRAKGGKLNNQNFAKNSSWII
jgi:hypothetical protein